MKKLVNELITEFPDRDQILTLNMVQNLPYLNAVLYESMRRRPVTSLGLARIVPEEGATICGHFIPGGVSISAVLLLYLPPLTCPLYNVFYKPGRRCCRLA